MASGDDNDNESGSFSVILLGFLIMLIISLGFWALSEFDQATYKYSFGTSDFSYKPGASLMSA
jgi:hypothetical protein